MKLLNGISTALTVAVSALAVPAAASAYPRRRASKAEVSAIIHDAKRTEPCGYNGRGHLSTFRIVYYTARDVRFKWASADWTLPHTDGCQLVFLHASGHHFQANETPRRAKVDWLPFTWGSSPFDNPSYQSSQWRNLGFAAGPPNWLALARELS
jgi:hypothetical protein